MCDQPPDLFDRDEELRNAHHRISELEVLISRLTADVLRLQANGQDERADRLEEQLRRHRGDIARDRKLVRELSPHRPRTLSAQPVLPGEMTGGARNGLEPQNPLSETDKASSTAATGANGAAKAARSDIVAINLAPKKAAFSQRERARGKRSADLLARLNWRKQPGWVISLTAHTVLLLLLALLRFAAFENPPPMLASGVVEELHELADELTEVELEPVELEELVEADVAFEEVTPDLADLNVDDPLVSLGLPAEPAAGGTGTSDVMAADIGALLTSIEPGGGEGAGSSSGKPAPGEAGEASFFGAKSRGNRFVFLIDNSGTMRDGRMETAILELLRSVGAMKPDQMFYVIFYSDQPYPMFYPESAADLVPASRENKQKLEAWLSTVEMCAGGELNDAVDMATGLEPAAVYLLSDGDIAASRIDRLVRAADERNYPIHTFGMTVRNPDHASRLAAIAEAHGGTFTPVTVNPVAVQMSRRRRIPYNSAPGEVWGTKVGRW